MNGWVRWNSFIFTFFQSIFWHLSKFKTLLFLYHWKKKNQSLSRRDNHKWRSRSEWYPVRISTVRPRKKNCWSFLLPPRVTRYCMFNKSYGLLCLKPCFLNCRPFFVILLHCSVTDYPASRGLSALIVYLVKNCDKYRLWSAHTSFPMSWIGNAFWVP